MTDEQKKRIYATKQLSKILVDYSALIHSAATGDDVTTADIDSFPAIQGEVTPERLNKSFEVMAELNDLVSGNLALLKEIAGLPFMLED